MPTRLEHKLTGLVGRASRDFQLIESGDRVMACVSGGKDSFVMLHLLRRVQRRAPFPFSIVAVNLDQGHPGFPRQMLEDWLIGQGYETRMLRQDTYSIVLDKIAPGRTMCSLCSRLRRGILYNAAQDLGCTRIALGHHRDDIIETLMLNVLYAGQIKAMPPRLRSDDGRNVVIRPLTYCVEAEIAELAAELKFPIIPCDLCGTQETLQRQRIKKLLAGLAAENPKVPGNIFASLRNVRPSHLLDGAIREQAGLHALTGEALRSTVNLAATPPPTSGS